MRPFSMVYNFFDKKSSVGGIIQNQELAKELYTSVVGKFEKQKDTHLLNVFGAQILVNLADTQLISKFNKGFQFLLCVISIYSKYAWFVTFKDKKGITNINAFQNVLDESVHKPNI